MFSFLRDAFLIHVAGYIFQQRSDLLCAGSGTRKRHVMRGMIFYYPHTSAKESRPTMRVKGGVVRGNLDSAMGAMDPAGGASSSREASGRGRPSRAVIDITETEQQGFDDVFSVFWGDRLVPETELRSLPFFPLGARTRNECEDKKLPENWAGRIKGFLFLDWEFKHIQNNKLQINIPDFEGYLKESKKSILYKHSKRANEDFLR